MPETYNTTTDPNRIYGKVEEKPAIERFAKHNNFTINSVSKEQDMNDKVDTIVNSDHVQVKCTPSDHEVSPTMVSRNGHEFLKNPLSKYMLFEFNRTISYYIKIDNLIKWLTKNKKALHDNKNGDGSKYINLTKKELEQIDDVLISNYKNDR